MSRAKMEPTWRPDYKAQKPKRQPRRADHGDRLALLAEAQAETRALLETSRLYMARDDFVDLLAARYEQLRKRSGVIQWATILDRATGATLARYVRRENGRIEGRVERMQ